MKALFITDAFSNPMPPTQFYYLKGYIHKLCVERNEILLSKNALLIDLEKDSNILGKLTQLATDSNSQYQIIYLPENATLFDYFKSQGQPYSVDFDVQ